MADKEIRDAISRLGSDWIGEQIVRLGNLEGDVETGTPGQYWARQYNGKEIPVINSIMIAPKFDTRVKVRRSKSQPNLWRITESLEDYTEPVGGGLVAFHREQHEENGPDRLMLDRKQIKQLSVRAAGAFTVQVFGGAVQSPAGIVFVNNELLNLAAYTVTTGAVYVSIEVDSAGDISLNEGDPFSAPNAGTEADIPDPAAGKYAIAYVLLYERQEAIIDNNIRVVLPLPGASSIILFNDAEGDPEDVSEVAPDPGSSTYAARRDHVHYLDTSGLGGGGSSSYLVMESGVTSPPVPIENSAGDDWIYSS